MAAMMADPTLRSLLWFFEHPLFTAMTSLDIHRRLVTLALDGTVTHGTPLDWYEKVLCRESSLPHLQQRREGLTTVSGLTAGSASVAPPASAGSPDGSSPPRTRSSGGSASTGGDAAEGAGSATQSEERHQQMIRAVLWRIFLRLFPLPPLSQSLDVLAQSWCEKLYENRANYAMWRHAYISKCLQTEDIVKDLPQNGGGVPLVPLGAASGGALPQLGCPGEGDLGTTQRRIFHSLQRKNLIIMDIQRSYTDNDPTIPHIPLFFILAIWAEKHASGNRLCSRGPTTSSCGVGYHQGMHEIAGQCMQLLSLANQEMRQCEEDMKVLQQSSGAGLNPSEKSQINCEKFSGLIGLLRECCSSRYLEADAYFLFDAMMREFGLASLFIKEDRAPPVAVSQQQQQQPLPGSPKGTKLFSSPPAPAHAEPTMSIEEEEEMMLQCSPLGRVHLKMRDTYLFTDTELLQHIRQNSPALNSPFFFTARWIRNLFTRELSTKQCLVVWDCLLAVDYNEFVEHANAVIISGGGAVSNSFAGNRSGSSPPGSPQLGPGANPHVPLLGSVARSQQQQMDNRGSYTVNEDDFVVVPQRFSDLAAAFAGVLILKQRGVVLAMNDEFSILRFLTRSPMVPATENAYTMMYDAFSLCGFETHSIFSHFAGLGSLMDVSKLRRLFAAQAGRNFQHAVDLSRAGMQIEASLNRTKMARDSPVWDPVSFGELNQAEVELQEALHLVKRISRDLALQE